MSNTGYCHITDIQAITSITPDGVVTPTINGLIFFSILVLDPNSNPVPQPGSTNYSLGNQTVEFANNSGFSLAQIQKQVTTAIQTLWNDDTIGVLFI